MTGRMEMRERVARAIAVYHRTDPDQVGPGREVFEREDGVSAIVMQWDKPLWMMYIPLADAAISAVFASLESVTPEMVEAGHKVMTDAYDPWGPSAPQEGDAIDVFTAMLKAARTK